MPLDARSDSTFSAWPTLDSMIDTGQRLVVFVTDITLDEAYAPYMLNEFTFVYETAYDMNSSTSFPCLPDRPASLTLHTAQSSGRLVLVNHYLYWDQMFNIQVPDIRDVNATNAAQGLGSLGE